MQAATPATPSTDHADGFRVTLLGHACYLVETGSTRILTDPWLVDPIFDGLVRHDPPLVAKVEDLPPLSAIAITHGHLDHFNAPTLARLPDKSIPVLHPRITLTRLDAHLEALGFHNRIPLEDWQHAVIGDLEVTATPSIDTLDECAFLFRSPEGSFWDGADAPQPPALQDRLARDYGPIDIGAFGHNAFDQPALLGLPSHKAADHALEAACRGVAVLGVRVALAGASNMRWTGPRGEAVTRRTIRKSRGEFVEAVTRRCPGVVALDPAPGSTVDRHGRLQRAHDWSGPAADVDSDYVAVLLAATPEARASRPAVTVTDTVRRLLAERTAVAAEASRSIGVKVGFRIVEHDGATVEEFTYDFSSPGSEALAGTGDAPTLLEIPADLWRGLFEERLPWQVLLVSDRLRVPRFVPGPQPQGLHPVYALQALFP
jgi:L-ascorbate metabolism protein UlaG (beta-lactamase superfamily)